MKTDSEVISLASGYRVYVERYFCEHATETVLMINGAFATLTFLRRTIRKMSAIFNIIAFDMPFAGQSRLLNPPSLVLTKENEVDIVFELLEKLQPDFAISFSWGGFSLLSALARKPKSVKKAAFASF